MNYIQKMYIAAYFSKISQWGCLGCSRHLWHTSKRPERKARPTQRAGEVSIQGTVQVEFAARTMSSAGPLPLRTYHRAQSLGEGTYGCVAAHRRRGMPACRCDQMRPSHVVFFFRSRPHAAGV